ncbi:ankyrin repeat and EF-hand domain-containing protein 1 isoform X3 [Balamuthia mandrillaris]
MDMLAESSAGMGFVFEDPISMEIMEDAVIAPCGHSFSKLTIEDWLSKKGKCPCCLEPLQARELKPNYVLREAIGKYVAAQEKKEKRKKELEQQLQSGGGSSSGSGSSPSAGQSRRRGSGISTLPQAVELKRSLSEREAEQLLEEAMERHAEKRKEMLKGKDSKKQWKKDLKKLKSTVNKKNVNQPVNEKTGQTHLHIECIKNDPNDAIVSYLLSVGANVNATDKDGWTSLHALAKSAGCDDDLPLFHMLGAYTFLFC